MKKNGKILNLFKNLFSQLNFKRFIELSSKRKFILIFLLVLIWFSSYLFLPLNITENNASFEIESGSNLSQITNQLVEMNVLEDSFRFKLLSFLFGKAESLKKGHYQLEKDITPLDLLKILSEGKESFFSITLIEGQNYNDLIKAIKSNKNIKKTLNNYDSSEVLKLIQSDVNFIEGIFFPDSYSFYKNTSDLELLKNAHKILINKLSFFWENRSVDLPYKNMYEALIMASIIEKEVLLKEEAPMVAGVFVNRLKKGMPLQSDPTVIYGMKNEFNGNLRRKDLKKDTPHNTYTRRGLPPTPISFPSQNSIEAALNPAITDTFYFVAMGNGRHYFSKTLKEHNWAVRKYQKKR